MAAELSLPYIIFLAAVDAVNPCALAVLALILIGILTHNPREKRKVLLAGMAFTAAIYVTYFLYGLIIIQAFRTAVDAMAGARLYLYKILGGIAIILGILNVKDVFRYRPGGLATEMPVSWRPRVRKITSAATGTRGAFVIGIFVTLFLLPCTIGPYLIAGGILSASDLIGTIPWLLVYNIIFVLPMIAITLAIYAGYSTVENVSGWKDRNIRYLHFMAGIIMFLLGIVMLLGIIY
jgi:cytochrome c biogenesis protein CcdA